MVHHGTGRAEGEAFVEQSLAHDLVISTYGLVRRDLNDLTQVRWTQRHPGRGAEHQEPG